MGSTPVSIQIGRIVVGCAAVDAHALLDDHAAHLGLHRLAERVLQLVDALAWRPRPRRPARARR
jgi:hypothetical protein